MSVKYLPGSAACRPVEATIHDSRRAAMIDGHKPIMKRGYGFAVIDQMAYSEVLLSCVVEVLFVGMAGTMQCTLQTVMPQSLSRCWPSQYSLIFMPLTLKQESIV